MRIRILFTLTFIVIFFTISLYAQETGNNNEETANQASYSGNIGDQISYYDGSLALLQTDLSLPGRGGLNLVLSRVYSSTRFEPCATPDPQSTDLGRPLSQGYMGGGWTLMAGRIYDNYVFYADGTSEYIFPETIDSNYAFYDARTVSGNRLGLGSAAADTIAHDNDTLVLLNGTKYFYGDYYSFGEYSVNQLYAGEYLDSIVDVHGNKISIYYDTHYPFIDSIVDAVGRVVYFYYDPEDYSVYTRLTGIGYKNHNDSLITIAYDYYEDGHLKEVRYPSGEKYSFGYTNSIYNPRTHSWVTDNSGARVLDEVITPFGGQVKYEYCIFDEARETFDDTGGNPTRLIIYYDLWAINERLVRNDSISLYDTTLTLSYDDASHSNFINIDQEINSEAIAHRTHVENGLGDELQYVFSCKTEYSNWFYNNHSIPPQYASQYPKDNFRQFGRIAPGCLQAITEDGYYIASTMRYDVQVLDSLRGIIKIIPIYVADSLERGHYGAITKYCKTPDPYPWDTIGDAIIDTATGISLFSMTYNSLDSADYWIKDTVVDYAYDTTLNTFAIKERWKINCTNGDIDTIKILTEYDNTLTLVEKISQIKLNLADNYSPDTSFIEFEYDSYGNFVRKTNAYGYYTTYEYDNASHSTIIRKTLKTGCTIGDTLITNRASYFDNGLLKLEKGANGDSAKYYYDDYDRLIYTEFNGLAIDSTEYMLSSYNNIIRSFHRGLTDSTWTISETRSDGFGRRLWTRTLIDYEDSLYYQDSLLYAADGRPTDAYLPWDTTSQNIDFDTIPYLHNEYDYLARPVATYWYKGDSSMLLDSTEYTGYDIVRKLDQNGRWIRNEYDFFGNLIMGRDNDLNTTYMSYKAFGRLAVYVPPKGGNYWDLIFYGRFGMKEKVVGPDYDTIFTYYDRLGNLRLNRDSDGTWTYFKYDGIGRMVEEGKVTAAGLGQNYKDSVWLDSDYSFPSIYLSEKIIKIYDAYDDSIISKFVIDTAEQSNALGRLVQVFDPTGYTVYVYDDYGRITNKHTYITGDTARTIKYSYTSNGLLDTLFYPVIDSDAYRVKHHYANHGALDSLTSIIDTSFIASFDYYAGGHLRNLKLGDMDTTSHRVTMSYVFDDFGRLKGEYVSSHNDSLYFRRSYKYTGGQITNSCLADESGDSTGIAYSEIVNILPYSLI